MLIPIFISQPISEHLEKEVEKHRLAMEEAKLKARGQNPIGTPALFGVGGFSPASKPGKFVWLFVFLLTKSFASTCQFKGS